MAVVLGARVIEVVRSLAMADIPVGVVTPTGDPARWSRYAHNVMTWDWMHPRSGTTRLWRTALSNSPGGSLPRRC